MNGVFEVTVHLGDFSNVDLFRQGLYALRVCAFAGDPGIDTNVVDPKLKKEAERAQFTSEIGGGVPGNSESACAGSSLSEHPRLFGMPFQIKRALGHPDGTEFEDRPETDDGVFDVDSSVDVLPRDRELARLFPAFIDGASNCFITRVFRVQFQSQCTRIAEMCTFRFDLSLSELKQAAADSRCLLRIELMFKELHARELREPSFQWPERLRASMAPVARTTLCLRDLIEGSRRQTTHYHLAQFDATHLCTTDVFVHAALLNVHFVPRTVGPHESSLVWSGASPASPAQALFGDVRAELQKLRTQRSMFKASCRVRSESDALPDNSKNKLTLISLAERVHERFVLRFADEYCSAVRQLLNLCAGDEEAETNDSDMHPDNEYMAKLSHFDAAIGVLRGVTQTRLRQLEQKIHHHTDTTCGIRLRDLVLLQRALSPDLSADDTREVTLPVLEDIPAVRKIFEFRRPIKMPRMPSTAPPPPPSQSQSAGKLTSPLEVRIMSEETLDELRSVYQRSPPRRVASALPSSSSPSSSLSASASPASSTTGGGDSYSDSTVIGSVLSGSVTDTDQPFDSITPATFDNDVDDVSLLRQRRATVVQVRSPVNSPTPSSRSVRSDDSSSVTGVGHDEESHADLEFVFDNGDVHNGGDARALRVLPLRHRLKQENLTPTVKTLTKLVQRDVAVLAAAVYSVWHVLHSLLPRLRVHVLRHAMRSSSRRCERRLYRACLMRERLPARSRFDEVDEWMREAHMSLADTARSGADEWLRVGRRATPPLFALSGVPVPMGTDAFAAVTTLASEDTETVPPSEYGQTANDLRFFPLLFERRYMLRRSQVVASPTPVSSAKTHLFVFVHGYQGKRYDMYAWRSQVVIELEPCLKLSTLVSTANEAGKTDDDIELQGHRLAKEIKEHVRKLRLQNRVVEKISFVSHSMGGLVTRAAIADDAFTHLRGLLHCFVSLASCHAGYLFQDSRATTAGFWILRKWSKSKSLRQLSLKDTPSDASDDSEEQLLLRMARQESLKFFRHVLLFSAPDDMYTPWHSCRLELHSKARTEAGVTARVYREMCQTLLGQLNFCETFARVDVCFVNAKRNLDSLIGRAAHIFFLERPLFMSMMLRLYRDCFM